MVGMAVATATLTIALNVADRLAREFRSLGANLLVTPQSDTLPVEIGGVDYRPVNEGAYLREADLGKLKMIFWRHNILGFTPFLDVPAMVGLDHTTLIGTWYQHAVSVPDGTRFTTGLSTTHPWWRVQGRWFHDDANECVLGRTLADKLHLGVGQKTQITQDERSNAAWNFVVTGIVSTGGAEDDGVIVPLSFAQEISGHPGEFRQLFVSALTKPADELSERNPDGMTPEEHDRWFCSPYISSISFQIKQSFPGTDVRTIRRVADTEGRILTRVSTLLWIITIAALIAAALAVAATSAATVLERRGEIGILKAIGATNAAVAWILLAEQLALALAGGLCGFAFGVALAWGLGASIFGTPASPRLMLLPVILGIAMMIVILGSLVPLRRAARLNPAPILRGE
jgi:putative ABC transport system permease protein